jgi:hypothetical protein
LIYNVYFVKLSISLQDLGNKLFYPEVDSTAASKPSYDKFLPRHFSSLVTIF